MQEVKLRWFLALTALLAACSQGAARGGHAGAADTAGATPTDASSGEATSCVVWQQSYGTSATERGKDILSLSDGGWAILGDTEGKGDGGKDLWLTRTDPSGKVLWEMTYGTSKDEHSQAMTPLPKGGFLVAGNRLGGFNGDRAVVAGTQGDGTECFEQESHQWTYSSDQLAYDAITLGPGWAKHPAWPEAPPFAIVAGESGSSKSMKMLLAWTTGCDPALVFFYTKEFEAPLGASGRALAAMPQSGLLLAGVKNPHGTTPSLWVVRLDKDVNLLWEAGATGEFSTAVTAVSFLDGSSIVGGQGKNGGGYRLLRLDASGTALWEKRFDGFAESSAFSLVALGDTSVALVGNVLPKGATSEDAWVRYVNMDGLQTGEWIGGTPGKDVPAGAAVAADGTLGIVGTSTTSTGDLEDLDVWMLVLDPGASGCGGL